MGERLTAVSRIQEKLARAICHAKGVTFLSYESRATDGTPLAIAVAYEGLGDYDRGEWIFYDPVETLRAAIERQQ